MFGMLVGIGEVVGVVGIALAVIMGRSSLSVGFICPNRHGPTSPCDNQPALSSAKSESHLSVRTRTQWPTDSRLIGELAAASRNAATCEMRGPFQIIMSIKAIGHVPSF